MKFHRAFHDQFDQVVWELAGESASVDDNGKFDHLFWTFPKQ